MFSNSARVLRLTMFSVFSALAALGATAPLHATDIAWHATSSLTYDNPPNFERKGTAVFKTGEKATFVSTFTSEVVDQSGTRAIKGQWLLRFDDGSTITMQQVGSRNAATGAISGSGEFVSGTGRFAGITGKVTQVGSLSTLGTTGEVDWVGSYSLRTDIAWHETSVLKYNSYPDYRREGTAVFKTGEKANLVINGKADASPEQDVGPFKGQWLLRFDDGSTITIQVAGTRGITTGAVSGSGEFVSGTGRYEGITGRVTFVSQVSGPVSEGDWGGSYSLPK